MPHLNFASDNVAGASAPVLDALVAANAGPLAAYGADEITREVEARFAAIFEREVAVFLVATGTAANALALSALVQPWGSCVCHEEAHVLDDECGAPEFYTGGAKMIGIPGPGAKLDPSRVADALDRLPRHEKQMPAQCLSVSQATECGLVYGPAEVAALSDAAKARGLALHMDGARFANALVSAGCSPADLTWRAGVDILCFGGTKNGCLAAEAVLVFDPAVAATMRFRRKRAGHTLSKGRLLAAQFRGQLADDHWLATARAANGAAARLATGLAAIPGVRLPWRTEANEVFAILPGPVDAALKAAGATYHSWSTKSLPPGEALGAGEVLVRMVASFATENGQVDALLAVARQARSEAA